MHHFTDYVWRIQAGSGREDSGEREAVLEELAKVKQQRDSLTAEVQKFKDCDPELLETLKNEIALSVVGANRSLPNFLP
jgi:hypothetical protein